MLKKLTASLLTAVLALPISFGVISPLVTPVLANNLHYSPTNNVDKANAKAGETLNYTVKVINDGDSTLTNTFVVETLSSHVTYVPGSTTATKGSTTVSVTDAWIADGVNLGTLTSGQNVFLKFQATIKSGTPVGTSIQSTAQFQTQELPNWVQCTAFTTVGGNTSYQPSKTVDKATATIGDTLTYTLKVVNTGDLTLHDILISDDLPNDVSYIPGSTVSTKGSSTVQVTDAWIADGVNVGEVTPGQTATVVFQVKVASTAKDGEDLQNVGEFNAKELPNVIQCAVHTKVTVTIPAKGFLKIFKFEDFNSDGVFEGTDKAIGGFSFHVVGPSYDQTVTVDANGNWNSGETTPGSYTITENDKAGWTHTTSKTVTVTVANGQTTEVRFGNKEAGEVLPKELPNTGPELALLGILTSGPLGLAFRRLRKKI